MRRKVLLVGTIIWVLLTLIILGVFIMAVTGNFNLPFLSDNFFTVGFGSKAEFVKEESFSAAGLKELDISTYYQNIVITPVNDSTITVRQYDIDSENPFTAETSGGTLVIKIKQRNLVGVVNTNGCRLEILLPESYANEMALASSSGDIVYDSANAPKWGDTGITASSGNVRFTAGIRCGELRVSTSSGDVDFDGISAALASVETSSGNVQLGTVSVEGNMTLKSTSGDISGNNIDAQSLNITSSSGWVGLESINVSDALEMGTSSGNITFGDVSANRVGVRTNSGEMRCGDMTVSGSVSLSSSSGDQTADEIDCESFVISTTSGQVNFEGLSGQGSVTTSSGDVSCDELDVKGGVSVSTNSGIVRIKLADDQNFELNITTNSGIVRSDEVALSYKDSHGRKAFATVGNGKNGTLDIKTSSGDVIID